MEESESADPADSPEVPSGDSEETSEEIIEDKESESDDSKLKAAVTIEVGGAWKQSKSSEMMTIQLDDGPDNRRKFGKKFRVYNKALSHTVACNGN